jgi:hypothetical protein
MATRICTVSFTDSSGITHAVDVPAETLYEAAVLGMAALRRCEMAGEDAAPGKLTELQVTVKQPGTTHRVKVQKVEEWLGASPRSPREMTLKQRLREVLAG